MISEKPTCYRPDEDYETIKAGFFDLYHNYPELYDVFAKQQIMQSPLLDEIEKTLKSCDIESGHFLDIGCGTGVMIEQLAPRFPDIHFTGIDPVENSLQFARKRCRDYKNTSFQLGKVEELDSVGSQFDVAFSSWGHIQWNIQGGMMERVVKENGIAMLVNNWGEGDDFEKLWPNEALGVFRDRINLLKEGEYEVKRLDSHLNLDNEVLFDSMSRIFGTTHLQKHRKNPFQIGIVLAFKKYPLN
ncbi:MAG: class I SAM-dependent methyltransferase [Candidatus Parabeggiatoa sp.]|nr:class I SAM-dependent methyltransferase [Candidatus Parabeggiatoa sp.]